MINNTMTRLMCGIGLAVAAGFIVAPAALAHDGMKADDMMAKMDSNHDGMISAQEHADHMKTMFDTADTNHDGMLSKDELKAGMHAMHEHGEHEHGMHEHGEHEHGEHEDSKMGGKMEGDDMMEKMDANHDGMISAQEHADFAKARFDRKDTNHDGMLSKEEMMAGHEMHDDDKMKHDDAMNEDKAKK